MQEQWFPSANSIKVVGRFVDIEIVDIQKSEAAGRNEYKRVPALESKVAGSHDTSVQRVKSFNEDDLKARFPGAWDNYIANKDRPEQAYVPAVKGTPLHEGGVVPREAIPLLMTMGFSSIEQLAALSDSDLQYVKGGFQWRKKAQEFLKRT